MEVVDGGAMGGAGVVIVFDFDKTILECDSDNWVVDELGANELFTHLLPTLPWNSLMDRMMMELHSWGKTIHDIEDCLKRAPIHPSIISAVKSSAYSFGCEVRILSDANNFFIETILKHHGLLDFFSENKPELY
ncbi:Pyridoxal phosphate phosphatase-related [Parasponia andersonii]|uniref:Pyridoxal phosphate phosphatase-related n=1 Tax=Parasponia andersonii TaxID=3476 RepID=A0A2P5DTU2_PARAD|nr:Pyridoxal phosphate phosphatase-related [Parasponia andersonii]